MPVYVQQAIWLTMALLCAGVILDVLNLALTFTGLQP